MNPKVFISYSWKDDEYKERVRKLAERLLSDGVEVILDQWDMRPGYDMDYFMEHGIADSSSVLILCEKSYAEKAKERVGGVGKETIIISPEAYHMRDQQKFIPVIMELPRELPTYLGPVMAVNLTEANEEEGYRDLLCAVYGIGRFEKPTPGPTPKWIIDRLGTKQKTENVRQNGRYEDKEDRLGVKQKAENTQAKGKSSGESVPVKADKHSDDILERSDISGNSDQKPALGQTPEWVKDEIKSNQYSVGDSIVFGSYSYTADGRKKELEWEVLAVEKDKALVITQDLIDRVRYNETFDNVTWETCSLQKWMNVTFLEKTFSKEEQSRIIEVTNTNPDNKRYGTRGGGRTKDMVFALSIDEANKYFKDNRARRAPVTPYAEAKGSYINSNYKSRGCGTGWWWLRSPGINSIGAAFVYHDGDIIEYGITVDISAGSVRPALWLNL